MASYLFRGQDRRDIKKAILALSRTLARDTLAITPKKTTAISTRQTVFDTPATYPGPQRAEAQFVLAILKAQATMRCVVPAQFTVEVTGGAVSGVLVVSQGSYPNLPDGTYPMTIVDPNPAATGAVVTCTVTGGVIASFTITGSMTGYTTGGAIAFFPGGPKAD